MKPGDVVVTYKRDPANRGFRVYAGHVQLVSRVGTVPDYWLYRHPKDGLMRGFVYEDDQEPVVPKTKLTLVRKDPR